MSSDSWKTFVSLVVLFGSLSSARAANTHKRGDAANTDQHTVTVGIPNSPIQSVEVTEFEHRRSHFQIEGSAGYSLFDGLTLPSYASDATRFRQGALPSLSLRAVTKPFWHPMGLVVSGLYGIGVQSVERNGSFFHDYVRDTESQRMVVIPATLGAELAIERWSETSVQPVAQVLLHPLVAITNETLLSEGQTLSGLTGELGLGTRLNLGEGLPRLALMLSRSFGSPGGANFGAFALSAAVRVPLDF
jgi:hypothetical protein